MSDVRDLLLSPFRWLGRVLLPGRFRRRRRFLRFDIYLAAGSISIKLFPSGELDVYRFFLRKDVYRQHDLEYLTKIRPTFTGGVEDYKPYGLIRVQDEGDSLPSIEEVERTLTGHYGHGLVHLPDPTPLLSGRQYGNLTAEYQWIDPPDSEEDEDEGEDSQFPISDMLDIMRKDLTAPQRIAWLEQAFGEQPEGQVAHRYYFDGAGHVYLVRHHWHHGKRLIRAEHNRAALRAVRKYIQHPEL